MVAQGGGESPKCDHFQEQHNNYYKRTNAHFHNVILQWN